MPRTIDHEAKRREVVSLTRKLITVMGINGVSMRDIARAAGSSTAIISYYFTSKSDVLLHIYRDNIAVARKRRKRIKRGGVEQLLQFCDEFLVLTPKQMGRWKISLSFTAMATTDERFADEYRTNVLLARDQMRVRLNDLIASGDADGDLDCDAGARRLLALVQGVATEAAIDASDWPVGRQRGLVRTELASIIGRQTPQHSAGYFHASG